MKKCKNCNNIANCNEKLVEALKGLLSINVMGKTLEKRLEFHTKEADLVLDKCKAALAMAEMQ